MNFLIFITGVGAGIAIGWALFGPWRLAERAYNFFKRR